jgi:hypothetical protein
MQKRRNPTQQFKDSAPWKFDKGGNFSQTPCGWLHIPFVMIIGISMTLILGGKVEAEGEGPPNHPKLVNPNEHSVFYTGLPPGQPRVWKERVFPNETGNTTALCLEGLPLQQIFPAAGPSVAVGVFCFGDLTIVGSHEFTAKGFFSGPLQGQGRQLLEFPQCRILVAGQSTPIPGVATLASTLQQHVFTCLNDMGTSLKGDFLALSIEEGASAVECLLWDIAAGQGGEGGAPLPPCDCDPVVCTPCCATCPDE